MLFTSNIRCGIDQLSDGNTKSANEFAARLLARRKAHLTRRHTCSVIIPGENLKNPSGVFSSLNKLLDSGNIRQVQFIEPGTDRVIVVDTVKHLSRSSIKLKNSQLYYTRRSLGNVIRYATVYIKRII